jgi:sugar lactone lactonase YvrE
MSKRGIPVASFAPSIGSFSRISACLIVLSLAAQAQTAHFSGTLATLPMGTLGSPYGMAVDTSGNVYVVDNGENLIWKSTPAGIVQGGSFPFLSGEGSPYGIAVDSSGSLYITDNIRNEVVKESPQPGGYFTRTLLPISGLSSPEGVAVDAQGNLYIADYLNNRVVKATPSGGTYTQSTVPTSHIFLPQAVAVDGSGNLYITDTYNLRVLKETPSGTGYTESVAASLAAYSDYNMLDIAADAAGDLFILEYLDDGQFAVVKETLSGGVYDRSTVSSYGQNPYAIAADAGGDVYIVSPGSGRLIKEGPNTNFGAFNIGSTSLALSLVFAFDTSSTLGAPVAGLQGVAGLDFMNAGMGTCGTKKPTYVYNPGDTCTVNVTFSPQGPGTRPGAVVLRNAAGAPIATAYVSGTGLTGQIIFPPGHPLSVATGLVDPAGVAVDPRGVLFLAESGAGNVYKVSWYSGTYSKTTIAGGLNHPTGVALDGAGNVYVAASNAVYKETLSSGGYVQSQIVTDLTDLVGIAVDRSGNLYLTSSAAGDVHKETLQASGSYTETAVGSGISSPRGVAVDGNGDIFVVNGTGNHLYAEMLQPNGAYLQAPFALALTDPEDITIDGSGNLYIDDPSRGEIDKVTPQANGSYIETVAASGLLNTAGLAADGQGNLYYSNAFAGWLTMIDLQDSPPLSFATTKVGSTSADSPKYVTVANSGNAPLDFPAPASGTNAYVPLGFTLNGDTTCPVVGVAGPAGILGADDSCVYGISFTPEVRQSFYTGILLTDNSPNAVTPGIAQQLIGLIANSTTSDVTRTALRAGPNPATVGLGVTMTVTVTDTNAPATVVEGNVTLTDSVGGKVSVIGEVALSGGKAVLTMVPSVAGAHTVSAYYGGVNDSFLGSTGQASLTVQP